MPQQKDHIGGQTIEDQEQQRRHGHAPGHGNGRNEGESGHEQQKQHRGPRGRHSIRSPTQESVYGIGMNQQSRQSPRHRRNLHIRFEPGGHRPDQHNLVAESFTRHGRWSALRLCLPGCQDIRDPIDGIAAVGVGEPQMPVAGDRRNVRAGDNAPI